MNLQDDSKYSNKVTKNGKITRILPEQFNKAKIEHYVDQLAKNSKPYI
jgi:hypothetical protein